MKQTEKHIAKFVELFKILEGIAKRRQIEFHKETPTNNPVGIVKQQKVHDPP